MVEIKKKKRSTTTKRRNTHTQYKRKNPYHRSGKRNKNNTLLPHGMMKVVRVVFLVCFFIAFYYFFVRPYAYRWRYIPDREGYGVCMPVGYKVHGIDISHYQGTINWKELRNQQLEKYPIRFVFVKATEGGDYADENFEKNFENARNYGFIRGAYHFYNPDVPALKQADFFISKVKLGQGDLPPVLDVEKKGFKSKHDLNVALKLWLDRVEMHYGVKPIIYASYKFKEAYLNDSLFDKYPYWIAHYYVDSVATNRTWKFWQHTDIATIPGIKEDVDLNIFNGSLIDLQEMTIGKE